MLTAYLADSDDNIVGVLNSDFTYLTEKDCTVSKVVFRRGKTYLFATDFDAARNLSKGDTLQVNLDSGIDFYYLATKLQEPFTSAEVTLSLWRSLRRITRKILHEREARKQLDTWDKQIYEVLFHEKQQPVPWGDSGLLVQWDFKQPMDRI